MTDVNIKRMLVSADLRALMQIDDFLAARDLTIRIVVEICLVLLFYYYFENGNYFFGSFVFYVLAVWHSFWGYAGIGHELMHGRVFSYRRLNTIFFSLSSFLVWSNPVFFKKSHNFHHTHTFHTDDRESNGIQNWSLFRIILYLSFDFPFMIRKVYYSFLNASGLIPLTDGRFAKIDRKEKIAARQLLLFQLLVNLFIYLMCESLVYNILWLLLPFTGLFINRVLAQSQHIGLNQFSHKGPLAHSRSIRLPRLLTFLYAGMNYHAEHHLLPSIPYYNLPLFSSFLIKNSNHYVHDWSPFFTKELWYHVRVLSK